MWNPPYYVWVNYYPGTRWTRVKVSRPDWSVDRGRMFDLNPALCSLRFFHDICWIGECGSNEDFTKFADLLVATPDVQSDRSLTYIIPGTIYNEVRERFGDKIRYQGVISRYRLGQGEQDCWAPAPSKAFTALRWIMGWDKPAPCEKGAEEDKEGGGEPAPPVVQNEPDS